MKKYLAFCFLAGVLGFSVPGLAVATSTAATPIPPCWKIYDAHVFDGLFIVTIPANDSITAKDVRAMLEVTRGFAVDRESVSPDSIGGESIEISLQFFTMKDAPKFGFPTQASLEKEVASTLQPVLPYLSKGVTISCFEETPLKPGVN